jgi:hypothetical protein
MANVWFVHRVGGAWKTVAAEPAYRTPLGDLIFRLDLGPQRRLSARNVPERDDLAADITPETKVFVEVTDADVREAYFGGYFPGWYDSPYAAPEARRRLDAR